MLPRGGGAILVEAATGNWSDYKSSAGLKGSGTYSDPYIVTTAENLAYVASLNTDMEIVIANDIDISAHNWVPFGGFTYSNVIPNKTVNIDGQGHTISGLTIYHRATQVTNYFVGLTGAVEGYVSNLTVKIGTEVSFYEQSSAPLTGKKINVGAVCAYGACSDVKVLSASSSSASVRLARLYSEGITLLGGIVGEASPSLYDCGIDNVFVRLQEMKTSAGGELYFAGGLVGDGDVNNSYFGMDCGVVGLGIGNGVGLASISGNGNVTNCISYGEVSYVMASSVDYEPSSMLFLALAGITCSGTVTNSFFFGKIDIQSLASDQRPAIYVGAITSPSSSLYGLITKVSRSGARCSVTVGNGVTLANTTPAHRAFGMAIQSKNVNDVFYEMTINSVSYKAYTGEFSSNYWFYSNKLIDHKHATTKTFLHLKAWFWIGDNFSQNILSYLNSLGYSSFLI